MIKIAITGAYGRMGKRIVALVYESANFGIVGALEDASHPQLGEDVGMVAGLGNIGVPVTDDLPRKPDVLIDFSVPTATMAWAEYCADHQLPLVVGTTGLIDAQMQQLRQYSQKTPILTGANMSLGVNLLFKLVNQVARSLPDSYDIEIVEAHHRFKRDAPSGTALELARQAAGAKQWPLPDCLEHGRAGREALRRKKTIGMHAVRGGDIVGEHRVLFSALGETVELLHRAHNRDTFVRGALQAAQWLVEQKPDLYSMFDVLDL